MKTKAVKDYDKVESGYRVIRYTLNIQNMGMHQFGGTVTVTLPEEFAFNGDKIKNLLELINS